MCRCGTATTLDAPVTPMVHRNRDWGGGVEHRFRQPKVIIDGPGETTSSCFGHGSHLISTDPASAATRRPAYGGFPFSGRSCKDACRRFPSMCIEKKRFPMVNRMQFYI